MSQYDDVGLSEEEMSGVVAQSEPGFVSVDDSFPAHWKRNPPKHVLAAMVFGLIHLGWTVRHYIAHAIEQGGFELIVLWGTQGSGKSNYLLQILNWVFNDWNTSIDMIRYTPGNFVAKLRELSKEERYPILGWDDLSVHMTSSSHKLDPKVYAAVDSTLAAIRTKCSVLVVTTPHISRLPKNVRDNITIEIFLGRNQVMLTERIVKLPNFYRLEGFLQKVQIEPLARFNMFDVPEWAFRKYNEQRLQLAHDAIIKLDEEITVATEEVDPGNMVDVITAASDAELSLTSMMGMVTRNIFPSVDIDGRKYIHRSDYERLLENREALAERKAKSRKRKDR